MSNFFEQLYEEKITTSIEKKAKAINSLYGLLDKYEINSHSDLKKILKNKKLTSRILKGYIDELTWHEIIKATASVIGFFRPMHTNEGV